MVGYEGVKMKFLGIISLALLSVSGCPRSSEITPTPPIITDQNNCEAACAQLKRLECEEGTPLVPNDAGTCVISDTCGVGQTCVDGKCAWTCTKFCTDTENAGVFLDPTCVMHVTSCDQVDRCSSIMKR